MATFEGEVTQTGWKIRIETPNDTQEEIESSHHHYLGSSAVERIAHIFIQGQATLQAEGQRFIRETFQKVGEHVEANNQTCNVPGCFYCEAKINGTKFEATQAETLTDSQVPETAP